MKTCVIGVLCVAVVAMAFFLGANFALQNQRIKVNSKTQAVSNVLGLSAEYFINSSSEGWGIVNQ